MGNRPKRKVVLIIVEGKSDREALKQSISELYDLFDPEIEVFFQIMRKDKVEKGGDVTSTYYIDRSGEEHWIHPNNIEDAIYELFLRDFFDEQKLYPKDLSEIIHIVDVDGAFIPDENVVYDDTLSEDTSPFYTENNIRCLDVDRIKKRNRQKRENLEYLYGLSTIKVKQKSIKYSIYYFSTNMDHFLHNDANLDYRQKVILAENFAACYEDPEEFVKFFKTHSSNISDLNYKESWEHLKHGLNSLSSLTNINLLLTNLLGKSNQ